MSRNDQVSRHWFLLQRLESARGSTLLELADSLPEADCGTLHVCSSIVISLLIADRQVFEERGDFSIFLNIREEGLAV